MIEISEQKMAILLTVAIQALVVGGLIACIVVGTQDRPSSAVSPADEVRDADYRPESASPAAYPVVGHRPEGVTGAGENIPASFVQDRLPNPS
ncbi:MAG: hypothetical protein PWR21_272 [Methanoculleus sp.]|uniref:hypothetical protein n=1 Tax=unclassified Methanoculleus TaxID=2619537 RepID=UPI0025D54A54|nr:MULTISPECIES: hypothetical protein [unclassified Methanoculleus]MDK2889640.1 hypothetical protein [Methanoculleus sp.]